MKQDVIKLDESFYKNTLTFTTTAQMQAFLALLKPLGVNYFTFDANYFDGAHIRLTTHPDWIAHYYKQRLFDLAIFEHNLDHFLDGYLLWQWLNPFPIYTEARSFNIDNGLTIIRKGQHRINYYHFGFEKHIQLSDSSLVSRIEALDKFIYHFHYKARHLIQRAETGKILLKPENHDNRRFTENFDKIKQLNQNNRLFYGKSATENCYITKAELNVAYLLSCGYSMKQVAHKLSLSQRTIEVHIRNMKHRLKCNNLFELGVIISQEQFLQQSS
ncbi:helix-turn-helix transcriptional regulator [Facilibium subflavum]|uniref:helix-turn-helix transcriptional regulator n=1 Tax=Facilibium subflavum TaxID=2219058 RepID=UPI000E64C41D|nr:helix-turn-helix transcriptional regulator [Facilibium subflavum]